MKKLLLPLLALTLLFQLASAQEHFSGINMSKRVGILNATVNPAELGNLSNKYEINLLNFSSTVSNNKISFQDIIKDEDLEEKLFTGSEPVNMRIDVNVLGPSFAMQVNKWTFGFASVANVKTNVIDVNVDLGNAINNDILGLAQINADYNQRLNAVAWSELGLNVARQFEVTANHIVTGGVNLRLLFPGSYMNLGISNLNGTLYSNPTNGNIELTNATAQLNIAYSGFLGEDFTNTDDYSKILFSGGINGFATDFGATYQWKPTDEEYKLKVGFAVRNMGSLTFKSENNVDNQYNLNIDATQLESLDLSQFDDIESIEDVEKILVDSGVIEIEESQEDFTIKLPTVVNLYADYRFTNKWHLSAHLQQKTTDDTENDITTAQNTFTVTPRFSGKNFEVMIPFTQNEISDFTTGFGLRFRGFLLGSGSIISAVINDSTQADFYFGFRVGI